MRAKAKKSAGDKRAETARRNGRKGGRPKSRMPEESLARLGAPPADALGKARWLCALTVEVAYLLARGEIDRGLAQSLRAVAGTGARLTPPDVLAEADRVMREDARDRADDDHGPKLEEVSDGDGP